MTREEQTTFYFFFNLGSFYINIVLCFRLFPVCAIAQFKRKGYTGKEEKQREKKIISASCIIQFISLSSSPMFSVVSCYLLSIKPCFHTHTQKKLRIFLRIVLSPT